MPTFLGFRRPDGRVATRNHVLVLPSTGLVNRVCELLQPRRPDLVCVTYQPGSSALAHRTLAGFAANPNVGATILVGLGDEADPLADLASAVEQLGGRVLTVTVREAGGVESASRRVAELADDALGSLRDMQREPVGILELILGTECGGSDAYSGLTANPALGACSDLVVAAGGTSILAETTELIGAEHLIAHRAATPEIGARVVEAVQSWERFAAAFGVDIRGAQPTPGNIEGGLSTIEEKSLGCVYKGGTSPVVEVVGFGMHPAKRGLVLMDTPGNDVEQLTAMAAGGAQVIVFTTGRGTPTACPIVPTIKVSTNSPVARSLAAHVDLDAGTIATGAATVSEVGAALYELVVRVASGEPTLAELSGQRDLALPRTGATP